MTSKELLIQPFRFQPMDCKPPRHWKVGFFGSPCFHNVANLSAFSGIYVFARLVARVLY
jgi:hypothetical protein